MSEGNYSVVLDRAKVIFNEEVPVQVAAEIIEEIDKSIEGVICFSTEPGSFREISIVTESGNNWNFWDDKLPKIKKIVEKHLEQ